MNNKLFSVILVCLLTFGLIFISCDFGDGGGGGDGGSDGNVVGDSNVLTHTKWFGESGYETLEFQTNNNVTYDGIVYGIVVRVNGTYTISNNIISCHFQGSQHDISYNETWNFILRGDMLTLSSVQNTVFNPKIGYLYIKDRDAVANEITTVGRLVIFNIPAEYEGKDAYAAGYIGNIDFFAVSSIDKNGKITDGKISNGSIILKVWEFVEDENENLSFHNFNRSGNARLWFYTSEDDYIYLNVTFTNGIASVLWP